MPVSPLVLVQEGAGPFNDPAGGLNVAAGVTLSIKLANVSGVIDWFLQVLGTDELSTTPVLTNVDGNNKVTTPGTTVTLTFPNAAGRAVGFQSTVTGTGGPGVTVFGTYSLINGARVGFVGETRAGDSDFGWITKLNPLVRTPPVNWTQPALVTGPTYTMLVTFESVLVVPTIQPVTINIITAVGFAGFQCKVKNVTTNVTPISVTPFAGESIEGQAPDAPWLMNTPEEFVVLESDGAGWVVVG